MEAGDFSKLDFLCINHCSFLIFNRRT